MPWVILIAIIYIEQHIKKINLYFVLLLLPLIFSSTSYAEWLDYSENEYGKYYMDPDRMYLNDELIYFWELGDYFDEGEYGYLSDVFQTVVDCKLDRLKDLQVTYYEGAMGSGKIKGSEEIDEDWFDIPTNYYGEVLNNVCKYKIDKKIDEDKENLNFINKISENKKLIKLNCLAIKDQTYIRLFIDDKLKKAVEIYPNGKYKILHTVKSNNNFFLLELHSVKIPSKFPIDGEWRETKSFYSKEEIVINYQNYENNYENQIGIRMPSLIEKYFDEEIRSWAIHRHTGISQIGPIGEVFTEKLLVKDYDNKSIAFVNLVFRGGKQFNCSKNSF